MELTPKSLSQQEERAEAALRSFGFPKVRVSQHGDVARIEIAREDLPRALSLATLDAITASLRSIGFTYITLDTQGYRSSFSNDVPPVSAVSPAK